MRQDSAEAFRGWRISEVIATSVAVVFLPPFIVLALAPMLLMLIPVAIIGIPFMVPAMLSGSLAARSEDRRRTSLKPERRLALIR